MSGNRRDPKKDSEFDQHIVGSSSHLFTQPAHIPVSIPSNNTENILELDENFIDGATEGRFELRRTK